MTANAVPSETTAWPDWKSEAAAIIAAGPSVKAADVALLSGRLRVVAIKRSVELAPFADAVYGCDEAWWRSVRGLQNFTGFKAGWSRLACDRWRLAKVDIREPHATSNALLFDRPGEVGGGGNSGFQALNLVAQWGADRILLIGFDCHDRGGAHWYGRNMAQGQSNPTEGVTPNDGFRRWRTAFATAAEQLKERGVEVVNASPSSTIAGFRRQGIEATLKGWRL